MSVEYYPIDEFDFETNWGKIKAALFLTFFWWIFGYLFLLELITKKNVVELILVEEQ